MKRSAREFALELLESAYADNVGVAERVFARAMAQARREAFDLVRQSLWDRATSLENLGCNQSAQELRGVVSDLARLRDADASGKGTCDVCGTTWCESTGGASCRHKAGLRVSKDDAEDIKP